jgi:predicted PurR-regulated permease PerM
MGVAVIGGLLVATLLSLVYVPAMFVLIDKFERWVRRFLPKSHNEQEAAAIASTPAE